MKIFNPFMLLLAFTVIITACTNAPSKEDEANLKAARETHLQAIAVEKKVSQLLTTITGDTATTISAEQLTAWKKAHADWKEALVEVPGMGHDHHDHEDGDHDHHHAPIPDLTPEQHKSVQQELLTTMEELLKSIEGNL